MRERFNNPRTSVDLVFVKDGDVPFRSHSVRDAELKELRKNPETANIMQVIENGPNATLYQELTSKIKSLKVDEEKGGYLMQAASSLFFGNTITDANIEGIILYGSVSKWHARLEGDIFDMETIYPEYALLKFRIAEIKNGKFYLPQNNIDLEMNANEQISRINQQLSDGTLEEKAKKMGVSAKRGKKVGVNMVIALQEVRGSYI